MRFLQLILCALPALAAALPTTNPEEKLGATGIELLNVDGTPALEKRGSTGTKPLLREVPESPPSDVSIKIHQCKDDWPTVDRIELERLIIIKCRELVDATWERGIAPRQTASFLGSIGGIYINFMIRNNMDGFNVNFSHGICLHEFRFMKDTCQWEGRPYSAWTTHPSGWITSTKNMFSYIS